MGNLYRMELSRFAGVKLHAYRARGGAEVRICKPMILAHTTASTSRNFFPFSSFGEVTEDFPDGVCFRKLRLFFSFWRFWPLCDTTTGGFLQPTRPKEGGLGTGLKNATARNRTKIRDRLRYRFNAD